MRLYGGINTSDLYRELELFTQLAPNRLESVMFREWREWHILPKPNLRRRRSFECDKNYDSEKIKYENEIKMQFYSIFGIQIILKRISSWQN